MPPMDILRGVCASIAMTRLVVTHAAPFRMPFGPRISQSISQFHARPHVVVILISLLFETILPSSP